MTLVTGQIPLVPQLVPPRSAGGDDSRVRVAALGGGHGLSASLAALRRLTTDLTAIVTVADDGGSSGRLRAEFDVLPPGDLRMALAALCDDSDWGRTWRDVMQHRFAGTEQTPTALEGHALGNLLIVTLWELLGNPVDGLRWAGALLGARGTVLPMSTVPLQIRGTVLAAHDQDQVKITEVVGQANLAQASKLGMIQSVELIPGDAPACPEALEAIELADWVVLGPGSWYTSVLPHLLLPQTRAALAATPARRLLTMNLSTSTRETDGLSAADHLKVLHRFAPQMRFDAVVADPGAVGDRDAFREAAGALGAVVFFDKVGASSDRPVHSPLRLANAYHDVFSTFSSPASANEV